MNASPHEKYVQGITESVFAVMDHWPEPGDRPAYLLLPPRPDLFLLAPSMYRGISKVFERAVSDPRHKAVLRALDRQRGYTLEVRVEDENDIDAIGPLLSMRAAELKLLSSAVGLRAAGTGAATLRLPPAVNRTSGVVGHLARFLRAHENPPAVKAARVFKIVQDALRDAIPEEHLDLISRSRHGIKIIADAPLEWLPIRGLPLGIRYDVSRINSTPGNLFMEQIRHPPPVFIPPGSFRNYLVTSMFEDGDEIAHHLSTGVESTRDGNSEPIIGKISTPKTAQQFIKALETFDGPMLIVDSHAGHDDGDHPGGLIINGTSFDIWGLAGKVRVPPIVVLSACDTHPFDRSHATVANGFLACGAVAVIATALPIRGDRAARFVARLINRAIDFADIMNSAGHSVPWTNIVGGLLRMEIVVDIVRAFREKGHFDAETGIRLQLAANMDLNPHRDDWYERFIEQVFARCRAERQQWDRDLADVIASSDTIRYLHLGNPESILLADDRVRAATERAAMPSVPSN